MKHIIYILSILFFLGCNSNEKPKKPNNLISKDKMVDIMYDVFVLNAAKGINKKIVESNGIVPQEYIYRKYNIDSLQFALSNNYYAYDVKGYEKIINDVKIKIEKEKKKYEAIQVKEEKAKKEKPDLLLSKKDSVVKQIKISNKFRPTKSN